MLWSEVAQSCLTFSNPADCSLLGSSIHGIFQARILEWVAISFSNIEYNWFLKIVLCLYLFIFHCAGSSLLHVGSLKLWRLLSSCGEQVSHCGGFSCCRAWTLGQLMGSVVVGPGLQSTGSVVWHSGLDAPQHVGSSARDQTHISCIGRQILYHWATREAPQLIFVCWSYIQY